MLKVLCLISFALLSIAVRAESFAIQETKRDSAFMEHRQLNIRGAADYPEIAPLLNAFMQRFPNIEVEYQELGTRRLYERFVSGEFSEADLITSSAMHLQIKLINDGYAQSYRSAQTNTLPDWASWRSELFGFTYEPAVIAYNHDFISHNSSVLTPDLQSRERMLEYIRENSNRIKGKIGTFDIEKVGLGYLLWSHDSQQSTSYGRVLESFGIHDVRLYPSSASMLQALADNEIAISYNLLGSYAKSWSKDYPQIKVILPTDYTMAIMRTAFIPKTAPDPEVARVFLDFLISEEGQRILAEQSNLFPINESVRKKYLESGFNISNSTTTRPIALGLKLLVLSDEMKRKIILDEWFQALIKPDKDSPLE
ncbi:ABC transporter substrate-binding protein [Marinomonas sp. 2405UD68-3]|uniref:ABC transporter substrate-binding protein n=1 Tax=Marinomonas sp. 2405UD68-3 TaxID=3391835 RepID=UPI0039C9EE73